MNYYDLLRYFATANSATELGHGDRTDVEQLFIIPLGYLTTIFDNENAQCENVLFLFWDVNNQTSTH